jgi:hypothetical protein
VTKFAPKKAELAAAIGFSEENWRGHCHEVSIAIVKAKVFPVARVARGWGAGITSQHSWVVLGDDCYDDEAELCDPTMFDDVWYGTYEEGLHTPHGHGSIWDSGRPATARELNEKPYRPVGYDELSGFAKRFLEDMIGGELSPQGWSQLIHSPVGGWPAAEIIAMVCADPKLSALVPIDIEGMLTDRNPNGLYLP